MKKLIMIIGEPGVGKTTVVKSILKQLNYVSFKHKLLRGYVSQLKEKKIYTFGIYFINEIFEGTDKLSMGVQPSATDFMIQAPINSIFMTEGDRLGNGKLLNFCQDNNIDFTLIQIISENAQKMRDIRGSKQSPNWIESRKTKINNLTLNFPNIQIMNKEDKLEQTIESILTHLN